MEKITVGRRIYPNEKGEIILRSCDYVKDPKEGYFVIKTPNGIIISIKNHKIIEHEDGTITVSPSIVADGIELKDQFIMAYEERSVKDYTYEVHWHGYLEKGVFREV